MLMTALAGQPAKVTSNFTLVPEKVMIASPEQVDSASAIGGFSFAALSAAVKTLDCVDAGVAVGATLGVNVGVGDGAAAVPPQAVTTIADAAMAAKRRIHTPLRFPLHYATTAGVDEIPRDPLRG